MSLLAAKNIVWLSISRVFALVLVFFAYTQLFRYLGPFATGQHQFVLSFVTIFGVVIDFGLQQYIIKKISSEPDRSKYYFQHFLAVELALSALVYGVLILVSYLAGYETNVFHAIVLAGLGMALNGLTYPFLAVLSAFQDLKKVAILNFVSSLVNVLFIFLTIWFNQGIVFLVGNQLTFAIISLVTYHQLVKKYIAKPGILQAIQILDFSLVKKLLLAALPFALLVGFSTVYNRIDMILITRLLGYEQAGLYAAAYKFFDLVNFFPAVVSHALYPMFATLAAQNNTEAIKNNLEKYQKLMFAIALPMAVGGMVLASQVIALIAGEQYADSAAVLSILVWAPAILFMYIVANSIVISQLTKFAVGITGFNVLVNGIGNYLLLPHYGIKAAAYMTITSELLQGIFYFYFIWKKVTHFNFLQFLWQPLFASAVMGFVLHKSHTQFGLITNIVIGSAIYVAVLLVSGFARKDDLVILKRLAGKA